MTERILGQAGSKRRNRFLFLPVVLTALIALFFVAGAQAVHDLQFQLDGDVSASTTTNVGGIQAKDWDNFFNASGSPIPGSLSGGTTGFLHSGFERDFCSGPNNPDGTCSITSTSTVFNTGDQSTFATGSKDTLPITPGWQCNFDNNVNSKTDISNVYALAYTNPADGHEILYFALERNANTGDGNVAFWFLQDNVSCSSTGGNTAFQGQHRDGDLLAVSAFTNGGGVSNISVYRWTIDAAHPAPGFLDPNPVAQGVDCKVTAGADAVCATVNAGALPINGTINTPWLTANKQDGVGHALRTSEFYEGGLDLTERGLGNRCFNVFIGDTRSSQSLTATLFDYARGQLGDCNSGTVTTPVQADGTTPIPAAGLPIPASGSIQVRDKADVTVNGVPTLSGSVTFHLCGPFAAASATLCDTGGVAVGGSQPVTHDGLTTLTSDTATVTSAGRYCWRADFSGDPALGVPGSTDSRASECFLINPIRPTLSTNATAAVEVGNPISDTATLNGTANQPGTGGPAGSTDGSINPGTPGAAAGGTITFNLYGASDPTCASAPIFTTTRAVTGDGTYPKAGQAAVSFTPSAPGTYHWVASYGGNLPNTLDRSGACGDANETSVVVDAKVSIAPSATNEVGQPHTFTITLQKNAGDGLGFVAASGASCTVTLTPANGATPVPAGPFTLTTNASGQVSVTFTSATAGTVTGHASCNVTVAGVSLHRETDSTHGSTGDAVKTFVDAKVSIAPNATNEVGQPHTFTITLQKNAGDGAGFVAASGATCTVTLTPANGATPVPAGPFTLTTNASGQATVTFTSATAGTVTGHASCDVTIGGVSVHRESDSTHGSSGNAVKTFVDAKISIAPNATNEVGAPHTFTVTLLKNAGDGLGFVAAAGEHVDVTLTGANGAVQTNVTGTCTNVGANTNASGQCSITFTSLSAGTVTGHASSTLSVGGVSLHRETDSTHGSSGNAVKTFVDAKISIAPNATNEVGQPHTFTVTLLKNAGDGAGFVAAAGEHVDVTLTNANGATHSAPTGSCTTAGANTNAAGQCTITFTSPTAGTVTGHATSTLSVGGVSLTRATDSTHGSSGDAVKTFVDANIQITPATAANAINTNHTLFGHVNINTGSGAFANAPAGTTINFSILTGPGSFVGGVNSCTTVGATGTCSVAITSPVTGTTTIRATTDVTVGGLSLHRETGDSHPGDSADATKNWTSARISIAPNATNRVGAPHTFTVTLEKDIGGGFVPAAGEHVDVLLSGTNGAVQTNVTGTCTNVGPNTNASGQCSITFTSLTTGKVTGHASSTLTVNGVSFTVQTDGLSGNSGDAVKTFVDAKIAISPSATNRVGAPHTFTVTLSKDLGDGAGFVPFAGAHVTASLVDTLGAASILDAAASTCDDAGANTNASGQCTLVFTSNTTGVVTGHASWTGQLGTGTNFTVSTGSGAPNSPDAVKTFVDAKIAISPSATNRVGAPHTFTVTLSKDLGDGAGFVPFAGAHVTASLVDTLGAASILDAAASTCDDAGANTNASGQCTLVFTSNTTGVVTGHASWTGQLGTGTNFTVSTGSGAPNSPDAVKTFVDAKIAISPSATNRVGAPHTFTVTLSKDLGDGAGFVPFAGAHVTASLVDTLGAASILDAAASTCDDAGANTNASGQCTLVFTSNTTGVVTGHASWTGQLGTGTNFTVSTGSGAPNSPDAVKTFVDAKIAITPNATNGITEPHTFTVTLSKDIGDGAGFVPFANAHVDVTLTDAGGAVHSTPTGTCTNAGANTDASGQCTITFTSNSAGTVTGHASWTGQLGTGTNFTVSTGSGAPNSADAVKTFVSGSLRWIKRDGGGNLLGGATFRVCATGGTAASAGHTPLCVDILDNSAPDADPVAGQFRLNAYQSFGGTALGGLALGTYSITETVPPAGYTGDPFVDSITITQANLNPTSTHIWVNTKPGQGCTPGFWKNHTAAWDSNNDATVIALKAAITAAGAPYAYNPAINGMTTQLFRTIFGLSTSQMQGLSTSLTLIGAINLGGGDFAALARHGTAALLSSVSVQYPYSAKQVLDGVHDAFVAGNSNLITATFPHGVFTDLAAGNNLSEQACPTS